MPARNTLVQLLALYTNPERHNAQRYRQTDRQTDDMMMTIADHVLCSSTIGQYKITAKTLQQVEFKHETSLIRRSELSK